MSTCKKKTIRLILFKIMTEALFSISNAGELISARYYTITRDTLNQRIISGELIEEILRRSRDPEGRDWKFSFEDLKVDILKKYEYKIEFFVSRDIPIGESGRQLPFDN